MPERPNTIASARNRRASGASDTSIVRDSRARSNRIVSCGSQASVAPAATSSFTSMVESRPERAVDLLGRRRGDDEPRPLARRDVEIEPVAARDAAGRVDEDGFKLGAGAPGQRTRSEPASCTRARRVLPATCLTANETLPTARLAAKIASLFAANAPVTSAPAKDLNRHRALERRLVEIAAARRIDHRAAIHHEETGRPVPARSRDTARPG